MTEQSERFKKIQNNTECVFAKKTQVNFGAEWEKEKTIAENILKNTVLLSAFTALPDDSEVDAFVMCIDDKNLGDTLEHLKQTTKKVIHEFGKHDPKSDECVKHHPSSSDWVFTFDGKSMHLIVIAPCYSRANSRYGFGDDATYFIFFSRNAFIKRHSNNSAGFIPAEVRHQIRESYAKNGRIYDIYIAASGFNSLKVIKPENLGECAIEWWQ